MPIAKHHGRKGRPWQRIRAGVLAESDLCHWCGHSGARAVDHLVPIVAGGARHDRANLAPIHGTERCGVCGRACNSERGSTGRPPPARTSRPW